MEPILTLQSISAYDGTGRALLPPMDLTIFPGERVRVITERPRFEALAEIIGGLREPDSGEAALDGPVGYMAPEPGFWNSMTVLDNTALPLMADGVTKWERRDAAMDALESVGLDYAAHTYPKSLSMGEQRLAALARALVKKPALLILTEPTSMLDEKETERFVDALTARWEKNGSAVLFCGSGIIPADKTIDI